jgi:protein-S-isoprenylcysteine O-methyltransferase Ste14
MVYAITVGGCWFIFIAYWVVSSTRTKGDVIRRGSFSSAVAIRVVVLLAVVLLLRLPGVRHFIQVSRRVFSFSDPIVGVAGALLCVVGVTIAVWARACLGSNWSPRPSVKIGHELITAGPYRLIRHPIYSGMLLAVLGTSFDAGIVGLVIFVVASAVLIRRIPIEEKLMLHQFPEEYARYKRHTKALIPFMI